jgi:hypothetical protein
MQARGYCIVPPDQSCGWKSEDKCCPPFTTDSKFIFFFSAQQSVANRGNYIPDKNTVVGRTEVGIARTLRESGGEGSRSRHECLSNSDLAAIKLRQHHAQ